MAAPCARAPTAAGPATDLFCWRAHGAGAPVRPLTSLVRLRAAWGAVEPSPLAHGQRAGVGAGAGAPARQVRSTAGAGAHKQRGMRRAGSKAAFSGQQGWGGRQEQHAARQPCPRLCVLTRQVLVEAVAAKRVEDSAPLTAPTAWQSYRGDFEKDDGELAMWVPCCPAVSRTPGCGPSAGHAAGELSTNDMHLLPFWCPLPGWRRARGVRAMASRCA